ncbi:MAG: hypothetical protein ACU826_00350 [Gammaproteobacteria bacterium]
MDKKILEANLMRMNRLALLLEEAVQALNSVFPLNVSGFHPDSMDAIDLLLIDGFRIRFSDLQDMLGRTLFKTVAIADEDEAPGEDLSTRERIQLMEKKGIIDAQEWRDIREIRNNFTHEYPDQHEEKAINLNAVWEHVSTLLKVAKNIRDYCGKFLDV